VGVRPWIPLAGEAVGGEVHDAGQVGGYGGWVCKGRGKNVRALHVTPRDFPQGLMALLTCSGLVPSGSPCPSPCLHAV
jgi:hypothetical protein